MATLNDYYKSKGQALPTVSERQTTARDAGISDYVGSAEQNASLLNYLTNIPNQTGNNVITADNVQPEKPIVVKETPPDTAPTGINSGVMALLDTTKKTVAQQEADYAKQAADFATKLKEQGDTGTFEESVYAEQGVDTRKKTRDTLMSQIEQEQKATADRIEQVRKRFGGTTSGAYEEIARIERDSANKIANYGIGLSAATRDYETAANIANRLIESNSAKIKSDIESRKFILEQLGTKLATEKANAFNLQLKQIDREDSYYKDAIQFATQSATDGTVDDQVAFQALQELTSGKISISDFYNRLGADTALGNVGGYDITSYATDPTHELKVQSIYDTLGDVTTPEEAEETLKSLVPSTKITGSMVMNASQKFNVDPKLIISIMQQDSSLGTQGTGARNNNPGNIGQFDNLTGAVKGYATLDEGVEAVAKWLNNHRSTGTYKGEFLPVLETVAFSTSEPDKTKRSNLERMKQYISNGDYGTAYKNIENTVINSLTAQGKGDFQNRRAAIPAIDDVTAKLKAYEAAGGNTGFLKGKYEDVLAKLGTVSDPQYKALATDLKISLQAYRSALSGAAFSEQEAAEYASVNPSGGNKLALNLAILEGMRSNFQRQIDTAVDAVAGDGVQYIRDYARTGGGPKSGTAPVTYSTPSGNSYTIVQE